MSSESIQILFVGDFIPKGHFGNIISDGLLEVLENKDFSIVNLESPLTIGNNRILKTGNNFKLPPEKVSELRKGKFDAVALSNNHIKDFNDQGVLDTIWTCRKHGILTVGAGENIDEASKPLVVSLKGKKIAFLNFCEKEFNIASPTRAGANGFDLINAYHQVREEKSKNDYVILIYHGGLEYHYYPTPEIIRRFKFLVDAGADCIVSHHTHRYSGMIGYKHKPIFFGLGNFLSSTKGTPNDSWRKGLIAKIEIRNEEIYPTFSPTIMSRDCNTVNVLAMEENQKVLTHIDELSKKINDDEFIQEFWNGVYSANSQRIMNIIKSDSLLECRLRNLFSSIFKPGLSEYTLLNILNLIRCDSHKELAIEILESKYTKMQR